jgi:hypothetical protein
VDTDVSGKHPTSSGLKCVGQDNGLVIKTSVKEWGEKMEFGPGQ